MFSGIPGFATPLENNSRGSEACQRSCRSVLLGLTALAQPSRGRVTLLTIRRAFTKSQITDLLQIDRGDGGKGQTLKSGR